MARSGSSTSRECRRDRAGISLGGHLGKGCRTAGVRVALQALEIGAHLRSMLVAQARIFFKGFGDDALQVRRNFRVEPRKSDRRFMKNRIKDGARRIASKRKNAGGRLVKHDAKREQI